jgi:hypothetical protein
MSLGPNATHPASTVIAITPNDATILQDDLRGLYIGGAGNLAVITSGGQTVTFVGLAAGTILPVSVKRVLATGTTATSILALA